MPLLMSPIPVSQLQGDKFIFIIFIDEIRYRVWVHLDDKLSLSRIEIEFDETDHPYDFTPIILDSRQFITWSQHKAPAG